MKILIGSKAMQSYPYFEDRAVNDTDYFTDDGTLQTSRVETFFHPKLNEYLPFTEGARTASLDELYTIKVSHMFWELKNGSWNKHAHDVMRLSQHADLIPELYDILYSIWEETHGKKKANLNATPEDFFKSTVTRIYDHDSIHASVAYYDEPLFNRILADGHAVKVDKSKFDAMTLDDQLKLVREEVYATALERMMIPSDYRMSPVGAYRWALKKTITSFSKGWFALFIVLHLDKLWTPDVNYVHKHKQNKHMLKQLEENKQ